MFLEKLNIKLKDFQDYKTLKELDLKFGFNIKDIDISKIDLSNKVKGNEILEYINDISLGFDIKIVFMTIATVLGHKNINRADVSTEDAYVLEKDGTKSSTEIK